MLGYIAHALIGRSAAIYEKTVNAGSGGFRPRHRGPLSEAFGDQFRQRDRDGEPDLEVARPVDAEKQRLA
jgi:hypothetical protein